MCLSGWLYCTALPVSNVKKNAKLNANGFTSRTLKIMNIYLSRRNQVTKINKSYSSWEQFLFSSVSGHIFFNTFLSDLFLILKDINIASYAGGNTLYIATENLDAAVQTLRM